MSIAIIIPARLASTRLPNKPLADVYGVPMIIRVMRLAQESGMGDVYIAAGDQEIADSVHQYGGNAILTNPDLSSGSDRVLEALEKIDPDDGFQTKDKAKSGYKYEIIINLQGDMPVFNPEAIKRVASLLQEHTEYDIASLACEISSSEQKKDSNCVKLIPGEFISGKKSLSQYKHAKILYFSRLQCLYGEGKIYQHIGMYAYRRNALKDFCGLKQTDLEKREKLEQLRGIEAGLCYGVTLIDQAVHSVDTLEDLSKLNHLLAKMDL